MSEDPIAELAAIFNRCLRQIEDQQRQIEDLIRRLDRHDIGDLLESLHLSGTDEGDDGDRGGGVRCAPLTTLTSTSQAIGSQCGCATPDDLPT